jgi:alkylated DNA repair dioxygenase AlkB
MPRSSPQSDPTQLSLLDAPAAPPGFAYLDELLGPAEESALVASIEPLAFRAFEFQGYEGKRRTISFGLHYDFKEGGLREAPPMPPYLLALRERAAAWAGLEPARLQHVLVNEYQPGAGIGWHRDRPVFEDVIGISLLSECRFRLRRKDGTRWERASVVLAPRSAYLLRGPVRNEWEHSIAPGEALRYSLTFRSLRAPAAR